MKFNLPRLYPILNLESQKRPLEFARLCFEAGAELIQIRAKEVSLSEIAAEVLALAKNFSPRPKVIINDFVKIAQELKADGVHLGQDDLSPAAARKLLGEGAIIGFSTHNLEQVSNAPIAVLDYLGFGPVFETKTKTGAEPTVGLELLAEAVKISELPLVAIGGIDRENASSVLAAGASSVAIISDLEKASHEPREFFQYFQSLNSKKS